MLARDRSLTTCADMHSSKCGVVRACSDFAIASFKITRFRVPGSYFHRVQRSTLTLRARGGEPGDEATAHARGGLYHTFTFSGCGHQKPSMELSKAMFDPFRCRIYGLLHCLGLLLFVLNDATSSCESELSACLDTEII